jgi:hypothetical protein
LFSPVFRAHNLKFQDKSHSKETDFLPRLFSHGVQAFVFNRAVFIALFSIRKTDLNFFYLSLLKNFKNWNSELAPRNNPCKLRQNRPENWSKILMDQSREPIPFNYVKHVVNKFYPLPVSVLFSAFHWRYESQNRYRYGAFILYPWTFDLYIICPWNFVCIRHIG